ncbi:hypothetical protein F8M41_002358 [Gigaspora margarita]|uniref:Uncharacterized protein n=1 Tax=Gigaspora margarita TaxID=4874 RepID=A0A8H4B504_GIGMA|nr:hypothetical protein F8M41_002358 [Gigaspora margarita]
MNTSTSIKSELPVKSLAHLKKIKTISGGDKYLSETALYRTNNDDDIFREVTFKDLSELLIVSLVQTVPVSSFDNEYILTPPDLPCSSPLLLFSAPVVQGSYHPDNSGTLNKDKSKSREELDNQLDSIEEKYATLSPQPPNKKPRITSYQLFEPSNIIPTPETTDHIAISSDSNSQLTSSLDIEENTDTTPLITLNQLQLFLAVHLLLNIQALNN